jgi:bacterioferritin-associated ferredoxin
LTTLKLRVILNISMIVCSCRAVSDRQVESAIRRGAASVEAIGQLCGAGTDCGACVRDLEVRLDRSCARSRAGLCPLPVLPAANADHAAPAATAA